MDEAPKTTPMRPAGAGERQTVDRVNHPKFGECWAVYDNGPGCLILDDGSLLDARVSLGGVNAKGSWRDVHMHGVTDKAEVIARGESHLRMWSPMLGLGWVVYETDPGFMTRFEPDTGTAIRFRLARISVGRPAYAKLLARSRSKMPPTEPEDEYWITYETSDGTVMAFRRNGPPPAESSAPTTEAAPQIGLFGEAPAALKRKRR